MNKTRSIRPRYSANTQRCVVDAILSGELLLEEAMAKYSILSKKTVVRWLKKYQDKEAKTRTTFF